MTEFVEKNLESGGLRNKLQWPQVLDVGIANLIAILVCVGVWTYRNSLDGPGVLDDEFVVQESVDRMKTDGLDLIPRPRQYVRMSIWFNNIIGGKKVRGYHQVNRLLHIMNALLLFGIVRSTLRLPIFAGQFDNFGANSRGFCFALIWLVHPLQTQAVTYMAQRMESMMAFCFLSAMYCLVRAGLAKRALLWHAGCVFFFVLGVGTKEVIAMLPFVLLLYDRAFLATSWREVLQRRWTLHATMLLPMCLFAFWIAPYFTMREHHMGMGHEWISPWMYARSQPAIICHYLKLAIWPDKLCLDYCWPVMSLRDSLPWVVAAMAVLSASVWVWVRNRTIGFLALSFFIVLAPTSSFMPINDLAFEHRMYLPLACIIGLVIIGTGRLLTWLKLSGNNTTAIGTILACMIAVPLAVRTVERNHDYQGRVRLWETAVLARPESHRARMNLARSLRLENRVEEAVHNAQIAFESICANWRSPTEIKSYFHHLRLAMTESGKENEFVPFVESVNSRYPGDGSVSLLLGEFFYTKRDYGRAVTIFSDSSRFPEVADQADIFLSATQMAAGDIEGCVKRLHDQILERPLRKESINFLSWILSAHPLDTVRNGELAVRLSERVCVDMQADDAVSWGTLASAYAEIGNFEKAEWASKKALQYCWKNPGSGELEKNRQQLAGYRAGSPARIDDVAAGVVVLKQKHDMQGSDPARTDEITTEGNAGN